MASEPVRRPIAALAAVSPAEAAIEPSATFSLSFMVAPCRDGLMATANAVNAWLRLDQQFNIGAMAVRSCEPTIASEQYCRQSLGERDIGSVISRHRCAQL